MQRGFVAKLHIFALFFKHPAPTLFSEYLRRRRL